MKTWKVFVLVPIFVAAFYGEVYFLFADKDWIKATLQSVSVCAGVLGFHVFWNFPQKGRALGLALLLMVVAVPIPVFWGPVKRGATDNVFWFWFAMGWVLFCGLSLLVSRFQIIARYLDPSRGAGAGNPS